MSQTRITLAAIAGTALLAGCGGSTPSPAAHAAAGTVAASTAPAVTATGAATTPARARAHAARHTARAKAGATTTTTTPPAATARPVAAVHPRSKPKSPVACMTAAGLAHVGPSAQTGTWQGSDARSHRLIFVDGPYRSPGAAKQSVGTLIGVNQAAAGGVWEVSASLRGGTGPAVRRVAACLAGHLAKRAKSSGGYGF